MTICELWITHPLYPGLMIILALWVGCSTVAIFRNWVLILRLKKHNKLLHKLVVEGVKEFSEHLQKSRNEDPQGSESGSSETAYPTE